ncbi:HXXEE domain-containing protein [Bailinhaonella thermotolerans]|uniref:HXXEE domain-containing protein n=1 Tax=Bailinhaonella thermotolerans TaxID=1070861 RepID=A0A3A4AH69_9ACTN|nr:HXXEE domain-containing protein [Bailinhaonella thermotolerans]RJL25180.1 HXXEE domain-containing protein [Bailinhaonella thermotolerans]
MADTRVPAAVTWGLFAAWAVHDLEELVTMAGWSRRARPRLEERLPWVPAHVWDRLDVPQAHVNVAIGGMAVIVAAASAAGARSGGRSGFYRAALAAFGWHAAGHLAQGALVRGYTPGLITAPLVVAPFSLWAHRRLRAAGVTAGPGSVRAAVPLAAGALAAVHGLAALVTRRRTGPTW